jgi:hypothetical protein
MINSAKFLVPLVCLSLLLFSTSSLAAYTAGAVTDGGTINGKLTFSGELPESAIESVAITKNPDVCGEGYREVVWVDVEGEALRGAFVFIDKISTGKAWEDPADGNYMIVQKGCRFTPWAQVIKPGPIVIRNSDKGVLHNINTREMIGVEKGRVVKRTMFNFGQPDPGDINKTIKPRRSPYIAINCEAHNFMFGFMMAPQHPYAVVVDEGGNFSLGNVPPGTYKLKAWHPSLGVQESEVTVPANGNIEANFNFQSN